MGRCVEAIEEFLCCFFFNWCWRVFAMRLSRSDSVVKRRKDQKLRNRFKGKKKHKKLDSIYENSPNKSDKGVQKVESNEFDDGGDELELRRSSRARRVPVLLDSSPMPPKKRRKVGNGVASSAEKVKRVDRAQCDMPCSSSRDLDEESDGWRSRLRARRSSSGFSGRARGESSRKGKRKLFRDLDGLGDEKEPQLFQEKEHLEGQKSTVVKSKRPGRIKASNVLENNIQEEADSGGESEDVSSKNGNKASKVAEEAEELALENKFENTDEIEVDCNMASQLAGVDETSKVMDEVEGLPLENKLVYEDAIEIDCNMASQLAEGEETAIQETGLEECDSNGNIKMTEEQVELKESACHIVPDQVNIAEVDCGTVDRPKDDGHLERPLGDDTNLKPVAQSNPSAVIDRKPRVKLGRRCGLCGGGTDGKPPKILLQEGGGSDNEAYSGSSASEEPNYDVCDGFGDQPGWLGRLLGPINDRFGIAGIWVHQQCAVWSPEVCFIFLVSYYLTSYYRFLYTAQVLGVSFPFA